MLTKIMIGERTDAAGDRNSMRSLGVNDDSGGPHTAPLEPKCGDCRI
jgi:hypothetical protein